jgi:hypothetical protein
MSTERAGALALIAGTLVMVVVMALHPSGIHAGAEGQAMLTLGVIVHALAIGTAPVLTFGFFAVTRRIGFDSPLAALGFFAYLFGALAAMLAATMSGLLAPRLLQAGTSHDILRLGWHLNQSFATLHVGLFSGAILLYALAWPGKGILSAAVQIVGFVAGLAILAWLFSGTLTLDVHGMGAVVLVQGAWIILAGFALLQLPPRA